MLLAGHQIRLWCRRPDSNRHGYNYPVDFKSTASTHSATPARESRKFKSSSLVFASKTYIILLRKSTSNHFSLRISLFLIPVFNATSPIGLIQSGHASHSPRISSFSRYRTLLFFSPSQILMNASSMSTTSSATTIGCSSFP